MSLPVRFAFGKLEEYERLESTDEGTLYFIIDRGLIYRGDDLVTNKIEVSTYNDSSGNTIIRIQDNTGFPEVDIYDLYSTSSVLSLISSFSQPNAVTTEESSLDSSSIIIGNGGRTVRKVIHGDSSGLILGLDSNLTPTWIDISDLGEYPLSVPKGGTGRMEFPSENDDADSSGFVLIGNGVDPLKTRKVVSDVSNNQDSSCLVTAEGIFNFTPTWKRIDPLDGPSYTITIRRGTFDEYEDLCDNDATDGNTIYIINEFGHFDSSTDANDPAEWYVGTVPVGLTQKLKYVINSNFTKLGQLQKIDASSWNIGSDSSPMTGWTHSIIGATNTYVYDVSIGDFITYDKLEVTLSMFISASHSSSTTLTEYPVGISCNIGYQEQGVTTFTGSFSTNEIMDLTKKDTFVTSSITGMFYGPFLDTKTWFIRIMVYVADSEEISVPTITDYMSLPNANQMVIRGYKSIYVSQI